MAVISVTGRRAKGATYHGCGINHRRNVRLWRTGGI
jgi:hypothetical protein